MTFNAGGAPFSIAGVPFARDVLAAEAGIDLRLSFQCSAAVGRRPLTATATIGPNMAGNL